MPTLTLCFKVHVPYRLNDYAVGSNHVTDSYFNEAAAAAIINRLAVDCYLPANAIMARLIEQLQGKFKLAFSISGTAMELLQAYRPDVMASFRRLVDTGCVELLAETYYNSLSWLYSKKEFRRQVEKHGRLVKKVFGVEPTVVRNTELIYNNELASFVADMGFTGILCEGLEKILQGRSPNQIYGAPGRSNIGLLLRNVQLSDDIAFRFDDPQWNEHPLTAEKYASWIHLHSQASNINLFMDYETFGVHKKPGTGIFEFLENLPAAITNNNDWQFTTPGEAVKNNSHDIYDTPRTISWKDKDIECCVWCENTMQNNMLKKIYDIEDMLQKSDCPDARKWWGRLQSADHFYYMSATGRTTNDAYQELNPFSSAEAAYRNYLAIITDFEIRLIRRGLLQFKEQQHSLHHNSLY